jgi:kumamolisin
MVEAHYQKEISMSKSRWRKAFIIPVFVLLGCGLAAASAAPQDSAFHSAASGGSILQLIGNPGFENGAANPAPWVPTAGVISNSPSEPHSGNWYAWLDGYGTAHTDSLYQQVTIPAFATSATLSFWIHIDTAETSTTTPFDTLQVQIRNSSNAVLKTLATYSNLNKSTGLIQKSFDLTAFKGQTIRIYLLGTEDSSRQTSFVVDDFALIVI